MFVLALIHTFPFIVYNIQQGQMVMKWNTSVTYWTGVVALLAQAYLTFMSLPFIRCVCPYRHHPERVDLESNGYYSRRFYEFFKATHFLAVLVFVLFFFLHCDFRLTSWYV